MKNLIAELSKLQGSGVSHNNNQPQQSNNQQAQNSNQQGLGALTSLIPGGFMGGAAAGGLAAMLLGGKSSKKMMKKMVKYGGTAVVGGMAYKAYQNWQQNKAPEQSTPISDQELLTEDQSLGQAQLGNHSKQAHANSLLLLSAMIAAAKSDGVFDADENQRLQTAINESGLSNEHKLKVFELMSNDISVQDLASATQNDDQRAEVYLSSYMAINVDDQRERTFLNDLSIALNLPDGFAAYLEQQADAGVQA